VLLQHNQEQELFKLLLLQGVELQVEPKVFLEQQVVVELVEFYVKKFLFVEIQL
jgi:hypothetical protein